MNMHERTTLNKPVSNIWERPLSGQDHSLANRTAVDIDEWWTLIDRVIETAKLNNWNKADVARRIGMPDGTFSQWFSGKYDGRLDTQNRKVSQWLEASEEMASASESIPTSPAFINTKASQEILETLIWSQMTADLVVITFGAGFGKTTACRHFCATRPHSYLVTVSPHTKTVHGMLNEIAAELEVNVFNPAKLSRAIGQKLRRSGSNPLLIIDEAQNLNDDAINQLRHYVDNYSCGVALVGNAEIYGRYSGRADKPSGSPSHAQLKSRYGKRLRSDKIRVEDLQIFINAWGITDQEMVKLLIGIGMKGGALRQIDKTIKLASMFALGKQEPLAAHHLQAAWKNRDVEDLA